MNNTGREPLRDLPPAPARPNWRQLARSGVLLRFSFLGLGIWLHAADELVMSTLITDIVGDIGGIELLGWTLALYEIGSILAGAGMGLQVARSGLRPGFAVSALVYGAGCAVSALAPTMELMLLGRLAQGFGGGGLVAVAFIAVGQLFDRSIWPQLFALLSAIWGIAAFMGPLVGGLFAQADWWRGAFWFFGAPGGSAGRCCLHYNTSTARWPAPSMDDPQAVNDRKSSVFPARRLAILAASIVAIAWAGTTANLLAATMAGSAGLAGLIAFLAIDQNPRLGPHPPKGGPDTRQHGPQLLVDGVRLVGVDHLVFHFRTCPFAHTAPPVGNRNRVCYCPGINRLVARRDHAGRRAGTPRDIGYQNRHKRGVHRTARVCRYHGVGAGLADLRICSVAGSRIRHVLELYYPAAGRIRRTEEDRSIAAASIPLVQRIAYALGAAAAGLVANSAGFSGGLSAQASKLVAVWVFAAFIPLATIGVFAGFKASSK